MQAIARRAAAGNALQAILLLRHRVQHAIGVCDARELQPERTDVAIFSNSLKMSLDAREQALTKPSLCATVRPDRTKGYVPGGHHRNLRGGIPHSGHRF